MRPKDVMKLPEWEDTFLTFAISKRNENDSGGS
jgi:hypothetical protein